MAYSFTEEQLSSAIERVVQGRKQPETELERCVAVAFQVSSLAPCMVQAILDTRADAYKRGQNAYRPYEFDKLMDL